MPDRSFADVLEETLRRVMAETTPRPSRSWAAYATPQTTAPFLSTRPLTSPIPRWPEDTFRRPRRTPHRLSESQQRAFRCLLALGAVIADDFTAEELRREYRRLAHRYHPDRHLEAASAERELLGRQFADATESYRCLTPVTGIRH